MQVTFSTLLKEAKVLKSAGTVSDKFNSLAVAPLALPNKLLMLNALAICSFAPDAKAPLGATGTLVILPT